MLPMDNQSFRATPMQIDKLLVECADNPEFTDAVFHLVEIKKEHSEKYTVERSEIVEDYINKNIIKLKNYIPRVNNRDSLFRTLGC